MNQNGPIFDPQVENNCISALLRCPEIFPDVDHFVFENDFQSKIHRNIYAVIKSLLVEKKEANIILIAQRVKNLNISFENMPGEVFDFLEALQSVTQINYNVGLESFKELKTISARREVAQIGQNLISMARSSKGKSLDAISTLSDNIYAGKSSFLYNEGGQFQNIYEDIEDMLESRSIVQEFGMMGPFKRVNQLYGSLARPGNITLIGARSGVGKSSLSFDYLTHIQENYNVPILHLDMGEMSREETQFRAICRFTEGKVPLYYLETGQWRNNPEYVRLVRAVWPRVKGLMTFFENVGSKAPEQIFSLIRRFYYSKVGVGKQGLVNYDYLKAFDTSNMNRQEYQFMGDFTQQLKSLITEEIPLPFWTSLQLNRLGITNNKKGSQIDDSENAFGISDRIFQQISHGFIMRQKVMDEIAVQPGMGNILLIPVKHRHLGEHYLDAITPVKMPDGTFQKNNIHLQGENFTFTELGDLKTLRHKIRVPTVDGEEEYDDATLS